jgi:hypothetical protein
MRKGRPPAARSPREKKALSYALDRRNAYRENDKASRKLIPLRKAQESRQARRKAAQALEALPRLGEAAADVAESSARQDVYRVGGWRKSADAPLGEGLKRRRDEPAPAAAPAPGEGEAKRLSGCRRFD